MKYQSSQKKLYKAGTESFQEAPTVSVITVTFNAKEDLALTMDNVLSMAYPNIEYIVIDGGSDDGSQDIIRCKESKCLKWVSEKDKGIYDAMNKGVKKATGEWVIFMNAGDVFASKETLNEIFAKPHTGDVIYGDVIKKGITKKAAPVYKVYHRMLFCHQSCLVRKHLLEEHPFDINHRMSADYKFFLALGLQHRKFEYTDFPISIFNTNGVSNRRRSEGLKDNMQVICEVLPPLKRIIPLLRLAVPYIVCKAKGI